jgi:MraZ protein
VSLFRHVSENPANAGEDYLVLRKDIFQDCLVLYPGSVWENEIEMLRSRLNKWNSDQQQIFRQFVLDAERIEIDASGRILIPKRYLQLVGIDTDVRFLGVDDTFANGKEKHKTLCFARRIFDKKFRN